MTDNIMTRFLDTLFGVSMDTERKHKDKYVFFVIFLSVLVIFLMESGINSTPVVVLDLFCTVFFICEIIYKLYRKGMSHFVANGQLQMMNVMDALIVMVSLPTLITPFYELPIDLSFLLVLRTLRIMRLFRIKDLFPGFQTIIDNFMLALRQSKAFFLIFALIVLIFALVDCSLFGKAAPQYFATPMDSIYTTFRFFTIEGWYDVPDAIADGMNDTLWIHLSRIYFSIQLFLGGIIGMSLINSIFVDAMVSDNNDALDEKIDREIIARNKVMEAKIDELQRTLDELRREISNGSGCGSS